MTARDHRGTVQTCSAATHCVQDLRLKCNAPFSISIWAHIKDAELFTVTVRFGGDPAQEAVADRVVSPPSRQTDVKRGVNDVPPPIDAALAANSVQPDRRS